MVLRHRKPSNVQESVQNVVQEMDVFVKVEEHYVEQSLLGAIGENRVIIIYHIQADNFLVLCSSLICKLINFIYLFSYFLVFLITWILALTLIYIELLYFLNPDHTFKFVPDKEFSGFVEINVDMTVAMPCESK